MRDRDISIGFMNLGFSCIVLAIICLNIINPIPKTIALLFVILFGIIGIALLICSQLI